jgi:hypothetical protein
LFFGEVLEGGVKRLSTAILAVILGSILAAQLSISGAAERVVRYAAEYAGENRFRLGLVLLITIALLFTTLGGLGAVILVASITMPLMFSLGFEPRVAGALFLFGLSLGGCLNPVNWALYQGVLKLEVEQIVPFAGTLALIFFLVSALFLLHHTIGQDNWRLSLGWVAALSAGALAIGAVVYFLPVVLHIAAIILGWLLITLLALLVLLLLIRTARVLSGRAADAKPGNWLAAAAVLVPLALLLLNNANPLPKNEPPFTIGILAALLAGIVFAALAGLSPDGGNANRTMRAIFEGIQQGAPAVALMIGIGLLLKATTLPGVAGSFTPVLKHLPVAHPVGFTLVFFILSPLALYRGPLNLYGMGSGVVTLLFDSGILAPFRLMVAFFAVGMLQGVSDPTNTHNVWIANFCKVPVNELTRLTAPWVLAIVLAGLIAGSLMAAGAAGL